MLRLRPLHVLAPAGFALALAACGDDPASGATSDIQCTDDTECIDGSCVNGMCVPDEPSDRDGDGIADADDNCPDVGNPDQADTDTDGVGDACDVCVDVANPDQADADGDGEGDACETGDDGDRDGDGIDDADDNCPDVGNPDQADLDGDGIGDACDDDRDGDDVPNDDDNCVDLPNPDQIDTDDDGLGDACDDDRDGDEILDDGDNSGERGDAPCVGGGTDGCDDNCSGIPNPDQADRDGDGVGDVCDDSDGDGVFDADDNCPDDRNPDQADLDGDGVGDVCDDDRDGDDVPNDDDNCPDVPNPTQADSDDDGEGDACDDDTTLRLGWYDFEADCSFRPVVGEFEPSLEWSWSVTDDVPSPEKGQVMMTPIVVNLTDDNGDGRIDENDVPDIVFTTFDVFARPGTYDLLREGVVRAVSGDGGELLWTANDPGLTVQAAGGLAAADLDGDGTVEIVGARFDFSDDGVGGLVALHHDGTPFWTSDGALSSSDTWWGAPAIADLDGDGTPEVVFGATVYDGATGALEWQGAGSTGNNIADGEGVLIGPISVVADVHPSPGQEVVTGRTLYAANGDVLHDPVGLDDGFVAVADFDGDEAAEIVVVSQGTVRVQAPNGDRLWGPVTVPRLGDPDASGGRLGPPTVADFDGNGVPDIGVAGRSQYVTLAVDLDTPDVSFDDARLWQVATEDASSNITGSSVFDFDADGRVEVVYNDEQYLRVFDGVDGEVLFEVENTSFTAVEYPVIADVDNDGNAEIVVVANNFEDWLFTPGPFAGVKVYGDAGDNWVNTRRIWNQHAYHITNVEEDGGVPSAEAASWLAHNTYRLNLQGEGEELLAPDLFADEVVTLADGCDVAVGVWVANTGAIPVRSGLDVAFYVDGVTDDPDLARFGRTTRDLAPGDGELVTVVFTDFPGGDHTVEILVDEDADGMGAHSECAEGNNRIVVEDVRCAF